MEIRRLIPDYQKYSDALIENWYQEISEHDLLGTKYFVDVQNNFDGGRYTALAIKGVSVSKNSQAMINYLEEEFNKEKKRIEWLKIFLLERLQLSQAEPLLLDDLHWYVKDSVWFRYYNGIGKSSDESLWIYQNIVYGVRGKYSEEEQKLFILEYADKERKKFEKLKNKFSGKESEEIKYERTRIPEEVRIAVWRRDQGKCARCGSREDLEYDHIVPVSKGGGNTVRNIELLCQDCNRSKGNRIE